MRNLSYTSSEEDLEKLFSAYGGCCVHLVLGGICFRHLEAPLLCGRTSVLSQSGAEGEWCLRLATLRPILNRHPGTWL